MISQMYTINVIMTMYENIPAKNNIIRHKKKVPLIKNNKINNSKYKGVIYTIVVRLPWWSANKYEQQEPKNIPANIDIAMYDTLFSSQNILYSVTIDDMFRSSSNSSVRCYCL